MSRKPDLSKVDEIGFADLLPGSGTGGRLRQRGAVRGVRPARETVDALTRLRWSCALIIACTAATFSSAQTPEVIAVAGVTVIDTINGRAVLGQTVTIRNGTIVSVTAGDGQLKAHSASTDAGSSHPRTLGYAHASPDDGRSVALYVANGVTGTRDMGGDLDFVLDLRRRSASGGVLGPRIVASGPILDDRPPEWPFRLTIKTGEDARKAVQLLKQRESTRSRFTTALRPRPIRPSRTKHVDRVSRLRGIFRAASPSKPPPQRGSAASSIWAGFACSTSAPAAPATWRRMPALFRVARQDRDVADTDAGQLAHHVHVGYATG